MFRFYRGWAMVGLGIGMTMLTVGSVLYGYSIYVTPVTIELGLSRSTMNSGIVFQHLGTALMAPLLGRLLDRVRVGVVVAVCGLSLGGGLIALGIGDALWPKAALLALPISFGFAGAGSTASYVLVARWFKVHRGRAMAIVALGQSGGSVIVAPIISTLIASVGWREALLYQGTFVIAAMLLIAWGVADRPGAGEHEPAGRAAPVVRTEEAAMAPKEEPLPLRVVLTSTVFWIMAAVVALTLAVVQSLIVSLVPLATGRGIALVQASTLLSLLGLSGMSGKFLLAFVADRFDRRTLVVAAIAIILGFTLSLTVDLGYPGMAVSCVLAGIALGGFFPVYSALLADQFGSSSLGTTEGLVAPAISLTSAGAIYLAGVTYDINGNYNLTFLIFSGALVVALLLAIGLRVSRRPVLTVPQPA